MVVTGVCFWELRIRSQKKYFLAAINIMDDLQFTFTTNDEVDYRMVSNRVETDRTYVFNGSNDDGSIIIRSSFIITTINGQFRKRTDVGLIHAITKGPITLIYSFLRRNDIVFEVEYNGYPYAIYCNIDKMVVKIKTL